MRGRVLVLGFLCMLTLLSVVSATETKKIYEGWHPYYDTFTIGEDYYEVTFIHAFSGETMNINSMIKRNNGQYIISARAQKDSEGFYFISQPACARDGLLRFCLLNVSLEPEQGGRADENGHYRHGTRFGVYEHIPDAAVLQIDYQIASSTLSLDQETRVRLVVSNVGKLAARNVYLNETVHEGLEITRFPSFQYRIGNRLTNFISEIRPGEQEVLNYYVKANSYVNSTKVSSSIAYGDPQPATASKESTITIPFPFSFAASLSKASVKINEHSDYKILVSNKEQVPLTAVISVDLPVELQVTNLKNFQRTSEGLFASITVEPEETFELSARLSSRFTGDYDIQSSAQFSVHDRTWSRSDTKTLQFSSGKISARLYPSKEKMRSGEPITVSYYISNDDKTLPFFNIQGWVGSSFFNETYAYERLVPNQNVEVLLWTYYPPAVLEPTKMTIVGKGTFSTSGGESDTFFTQKEILVLPENQSLILYQDLSTKTLSRGDELTITISAENIADSGFHVLSAREIFDPELLVTFGRTSFNMNLQGGEKVQMYVYKLTVPLQWTKDSFNITSILRSGGADVMTINTPIIVEDPLDPSQIVFDPQTNETIIINETQPPAPEPPPDDKKPSEAIDWDAAGPNENFFQRLVKGIADFFASLF